LTRCLRFGIFSGTALHRRDFPGSIQQQISERSEEKLDGEEESEGQEA
jgi:hypothetical protein